MLEDQFRGNSVFYGGEEYVNFADIYIVNLFIILFLFYIFSLLLADRRGRRRGKDASTQGIRAKNQHRKRCSREKRNND